MVKNIINIVQDLLSIPGFDMSNWKTVSLFFLNILSFSENYRNLRNTVCCVLASFVVYIRRNRKIGISGLREALARMRIIRLSFSLRHVTAKHSIKAWHHR